MKTIELSLYSVRTEERGIKTSCFSFLRTGGTKGKKLLKRLVRECYPKDSGLSLRRVNGYSIDGGDGKVYFILIGLGSAKGLTDDAVASLGTGTPGWEYYYGIALERETRELSLISYSDKYQPNWNDEYILRRLIPLKDVSFQVLNGNGCINRMEERLQRALDDELLRGKELFTEGKDGVRMVIRESHGGIDTISGESVSSVFRDYADNYTGRRNFRRPDAPEWEIADPSVRERFLEWKNTATGLKSDFDKFYGGAVVD